MARHLPLTATRIKSTTASDHDAWLSDDHGVRGRGRLLLRVTPGNVRRFYYRPPRRPGLPGAPIPLGAYSRTRKEGYLTLQQARTKADDLASRFLVSDLHAESAPPILPPKPLALPARVGVGHRTDDGAGLLLEELCRNYVAWLYAQGKASTRAVENEFKRFIYGQSIGQQPARKLDTDAFMTLLRAVRRTTSEKVANKLRAYLRTAYANAMQAATDFSADESQVDHGIVSNPLASIQPKLQKPRERALSRDELRGLWRRLHPIQAEDLPIEVRAVRLSILLGGQRLEQLLRATGAEIDLEARTLLLMDPKGRRSQPRPHLLPLGPLAKAEVKLLLEQSRSMNSPLFAGVNSGKKLTSSRVSKLVTHISREMVAAQQATGPFQYLDLRRTIETTMADLGVHKDIRAQLQSHGLSGVQEKHYDKHDYLPQKRRTLHKWEAFLSGLLGDIVRPRTRGAGVTGRQG
jgi:integrase